MKIRSGIRDGGNIAKEKICQRLKRTSCNLKDAFFFSFFSQKVVLPVLMNESPQFPSREKLKNLF
jgi:hypothetical protein